MDKQRANRLDDLFREQFHDHEIAPQEDYWPYLEKSLNRMSFFRFGWTHINIYNVSIGLLAIAIPIIYFLWPREKAFVPETPDLRGKQENTIGVDSLQRKKKSVSIEDIAPAKKDISRSTKKELREKTIHKEEKQQDSLPVAAPVMEEKIIPAQPEPVKVVEEKPKQKKIIYVVQQDTIVEKDTVKVRRKRKN